MYSHGLAMDAFKSKYFALLTTECYQLYLFHNYKKT